MVIDLHDELIENYISRHLRVKIRTHYLKEDVTAVRKEIVSLVSEVSGIVFTELQNSNARALSKSKGKLKTNEKIFY